MIEYIKSDFLKQFISIMPKMQLYVLLREEAKKFHKAMLDLANSDYEYGPRWFGYSERYGDIVNFFNDQILNNEMYKQDVELAASSSEMLILQVLEKNYEPNWKDMKQREKKIEFMMDVYFSHMLFLVLTNEYRHSHMNLPSRW